MAIALAFFVTTSAVSLGGDENYLPPDPELAITINLKQIFNSEMVKASPDAVDELKEVLGQFAGLNPVQKYLKEAGFDAFRDLQTITFAYTEGKELRPTFLLLKGDFNAGKLNEAMKAGSAIRVVKSGTPTIYDLTPRGEKPFHAALLSPTTLIAATRIEALNNGPAQGEGSKQSAIKKELAKSFSSLDNQQSVMFVSSGKALSQLIADTTIPNADKVATLLQTLDVVSGGITFGKGIKFQLACNVENEETARRLSESANGAVKILHTLVRQNAEREAKFLPVADVVTALRFTNQGAGITLRGEMSLDTVEILMKNFPVNHVNRERK
jgi:hypothetical protein